jgi:hypothetical protein
MELNSFCTAKIKSNETIYRKEKNICKLYIWQGANIQSKIIRSWKNSTAN